MAINISKRNHAIIAFTKPAVSIAHEIKTILNNCEIYCPEDIASQEEISFDKAGPVIRNLFTQKIPIIGICTTGILIRTLAPIISNKDEDPPVLAVSIDKSFVIPLLGGHRGANKIGHLIATALSANMVSTTSSEAIIGFALDDPPEGWSVSSESNIKGVSRALINGSPVKLNVEAGDGSWAERRNLWNESGEIEVTLSDKSDALGDVVIHPKTLVVGVGCERGAAANDLISLTEKMLKKHKLALESIACIASVDIKADEEAIRAISSHFGVPLRLFDVSRLNQETLRLSNPSEIVFREIGCYEVSEGAALAAAGTNATLVVQKIKGIGVTCAVARSSDVIDIEKVGRGIGKLTIAGIGPGHNDWITPRVQKALIEAKHHVGYSLYIDLVSRFKKHAQIHSFPIGEETDRAKKALDLASRGEDTALICSGDAGVYGMASLIFELLHHNPNNDWRFTEIIVEPGITAMQAAAARSGAPLGHDFCAISLSDLLTPWLVIQNRLKAALETDFVVALYNPAAKNRRLPIKKAIKIIKKYRNDSCPVILGRCIGRENEKLIMSDLGSLELEKIDMLTVIIVGNSETQFQHRSGRPFIYTPRGYKP